MLAESKLNRRVLGLAFPLVIALGMAFVSSPLPGQAEKTGDPKNTPVDTERAEVTFDAYDTASDLDVFFLKQVNDDYVARTFVTDIEDFMVRRQVRNKKNRTKRREFDVIAVGDNQVIINETKSTSRIDYIDVFIEVLAQIEDYFPEYTGKKIIPLFSSLYIGEDIVNYLTRNRIYAMGMGEEKMELINFRQLNQTS